MCAALANLNSGLLTELERQQQYLADLPSGYDFPIFSGRQAVESQRKSGYKSSARAAREIVDNAYEAGAKNVHIVFDRPSETGREKGQRKNAVSAIAFIDDGPGMLPRMTRFALSWGGGTHFKDPKGIGKFGFGLPNSSINQTKRVEVFTKTLDEKEWWRAVLDINDGHVPLHGLVKIPEPEVANLPRFVREYFERKEILLRSGTVVVWDKPDRLSYRQASSLKEHLIEDFGVVYRGLLQDFSVIVDGTAVEKVDPLFLTPGARLFKTPEDGGATCTFDRTFPLKYFRDPESGAQQLELLREEEELKKAREDVDVEAVGVIRVKIARFPYGFALGQKGHKGTDEYKRFEIRKPRRGMSFVRSGREIETVDVFPKSSSDEASGLGSWPLLQGYAYHWGIEVSFNPELDDAFGIGNDKQSVRPIEDFWRVLCDAKIDKALSAEDVFQKKTRKKEEEEKAVRERENPDQPSPATEAAAAAKATMGRKTELPDSMKQEAKTRVEEEVKKRAEESGKPVDEVREAITEEAKRKEYAIQFFESEGGVFYKPGLGNGLQKVAMINKAHPFFEVFYTELANLPNSRARNAVDLILLALAQAELHAGDHVREIYEHQREQEWSPFMKVGLNVLERMEGSSEDEQEEDMS